MESAPAVQKENACRKPGPAPAYRVKDVVWLYVKKLKIDTHRKAQVEEPQSIPHYKGHDPLRLQTGNAREEICPTSHTNLLRLAAQLDVARLANTSSPCRQLRLITKKSRPLRRSGTRNITTKGYRYLTQISAKDVINTQALEQYYLRYLGRPSPDGYRADDNAMLEERPIFLYVLSSFIVSSLRLRRVRSQLCHLMGFQYWKFCIIYIYCVC